MEPPLAVWESFYVIVGSSAAALTGLQFVVIVLAAESHSLGDTPAVQAFGTPTIVHFCAVLLISAILSAPWHGLLLPALSLGACGVAGVVYAVITARRARAQTTYVPVFEDWVWHTALPFIAYVSLPIAATVLRRYPRPSLFAVGATAILLLFIGIHNAWDAVTYIALTRRQSREEARDQSSGSVGVQK